MAASMRATRFCVLYRNHGQGLFLRNGWCTEKRYIADLTVNHDLHMDREVLKQLMEKRVNHRKHPGILHVKRVELPSKLQAAIQTLSEKYPTPNLQKKADEMAEYLWRRFAPLEYDQVQQRVRQIEDKILSREKIDLEAVTPSELSLMKPNLENKAAKLWSRNFNAWDAVQYDAYRGFLYLVGRISNDYSTMYRIFHEIQMRDPTFKPWTVYDWGSGVGSSIWAVNEIWKDTTREHYCVDASEDMNTISRLLLQGGDEHRDMCYPGVYYRQFFPSNVKNKYDLVISSYTLCEMSSREERLKNLLSLWRKTEKYLVLVENGSRGGFQIICEARDLLLQLGEESFSTRQGSSTEDLTGHVFAPCPHDSPCPRALRQDGNLCNFEVDYKPFEVRTSGSRKGKKARRVPTSRFSYVVLQKGPRSETEAAWPRIVNKVLRPSRRAHCRTCAPNGSLEMSTVTAAKNGRDMYWCTRNCKWGDLIPATSPNWEGGPKLTYATLAQPGDGDTAREGKAQSSRAKRVVLSQSHLVNVEAPPGDSMPIDPAAPDFYRDIRHVEPEQASQEHRDSETGVEGVNNDVMEKR